jgi:large repetitive protein
LIGDGSSSTLAAITGITLGSFNSLIPFSGIDPTLAGGITLNNNNTLRGLIGGSVSGFSISGTAVGNLNISESAINNATGGGFNVGTSGVLTVTLDSLTSAGGTNGVNLVGCSGTFTANAGTITNPTGAAFAVSGGSVTSTYAGNITKNNNAATAINIANNTGGTITFSGSSKTLSTSTASAVNLATNPGATINFTGGGLAITTTSGAGFSATGGATAVNVTGTGNTITSTTGTALNVASTTIGASGLAFQSIAANGAANGIVLNNTGTNAGLTVTGTGSADSGGVIQNSTGDGVQLNNTRNVSLTRMAINNSGQSHIDATSVNGLTLNNVNTNLSVAAGILGNTVTALNITGGVFNRSALNNTLCNFHGVDITNLLGTSSVTGATFQRSNTIQFRVNNNTASVAAPATPTDVLTVSGTTWNNHNVGLVPNGTLCFGDHLSVSSDTGGNFKLVVNGTNGINNVNDISQTNGGGIGVLAASNGSGTTHASVTALKTANNTAGFGAGGTSTSNIRFNGFDNRTSNGTGFSGTGVMALLLTCTSSGVCEGAFTNNSISHSAGPATNALQTIVEGNGTGRVQINNNTINGNYQRGVQGQARLGTGSLNLNMITNTLTQTDTTGTALQQINLETGGSGTGHGNTLCLNKASNSINLSPGAGHTAAHRLNNRSTTSCTLAACNFRLQDFTGNGSSTTDVANWVSTQKANTGTPVTVTLGAAFSASVGACPTPTLP